jgi:hypothetical protein
LFFVAPQASRRSKLAWALALAVFSHFVLDLIVHVPDLPVFGQGSIKLGLGLWRACLSHWLLNFFRCGRSGRLSALGSAFPGQAFLIGGTVVFTAAGPYLPGEVPPPLVLALSSLVTLIVIVLLGFVVEGRVGAMAVRRVAV